MKNIQTRLNKGIIFKLIISLLPQFFVVDKVCAQDFTWEYFVEKISTDEELENYGWLDMIDELEYIHEHPVNLNTASRQDLERLPFLSDAVIEDILAYIYTYGPMETLGELLMIEKMDFQTRGFLKLFVYVSTDKDNSYEQDVKNLLKRGDNELISRIDIPLYQRNGYKIPPVEDLIKNPNKVYLGNPLYNSIRYKYTCSKILSAGISMEKDSGEPFGGNGNWSYDSFSFHLMTGKWGIIKSAAIGDYRISLGEGLVINTGFSLGKFSFTNRMNRKEPITRFSSTSETGFLRGAAITLGNEQWEFTSFYSYLPQDATLVNDSEISSLKTDGLHRTFSEINKKHNTVEQTAGANLSYINKYFSVGLTTLYQHFNRSFSVSNSFYRQFYPQGNEFINIGVDYRTQLYNIYFSGEVAYSDNYNGMATINRAEWRISNQYRLMMVQRYYSHKYVGLKANAFAEGGAVKNENGVYIGLEMSPLNELKFMAYGDIYYFVWPKFGVDHSTRGGEGCLQAEWITPGNIDLTMRYTFKRKYRYDIPYSFNKLKFQARRQFFNNISILLTARYTHMYGDNDERRQSWLFGINSTWKSGSDKFRMALGTAWFDSRDYRVTQSFYEPGLLYSFSSSLLYGQGIRNALTLRYDINDSWMIMLKHGISYYTDREQIGTGLQCIEAPFKNDISCQLRYKF